MKKMFVKTGDTVQVLSGKSKGVQGEVLAVSPKEDKVMIMECRPMSKDKNWRVVEIIEKAK